MRNFDIGSAEDRHFARMREMGHDVDGRMARMPRGKPRMPRMPRGMDDMHHGRLHDDDYYSDEVNTHGPAALLLIRDTVLCWSFLSDSAMARCSMTTSNITSAPAATRSIATSVQLQPPPLY